MRKRCTIRRVVASSNPIRVTKKLFKIIKPTGKVTVIPQHYEME